MSTFTLLHIKEEITWKNMKLSTDEKPNPKILVQGNLGQLNYAETENIDSHQTINQGENNDIQKVAQELIQLLEETSIENPDVKEDALDFVEEIAQNVVHSFVSCPFESPHMPDHFVFLVQFSHQKTLHSTSHTLIEFLHQLYDYSLRHQDKWLRINLELERL